MGECFDADLSALMLLDQLFKPHRELLEQQFRILFQIFEVGVL